MKFTVLFRIFYLLMLQFVYVYLHSITKLSEKLLIGDDTEMRSNIEYGGWIKISKNPIMRKWLNRTRPAFEPFFINKFFRPELGVYIKNNLESLPLNKYHFYSRIYGKQLVIYDSFQNLRPLRNLTILAVDYLNNQRNVYSLRPCLVITFVYPKGPKGQGMLNLCPVKPNDNLLIYCRLKNNLGKKSSDCIKVIDYEKVGTIVIKKTYLQPIFLLPIPSPMCNKGWNYRKEGEDWECTCKEGKLQSPIDLPSVDDTILIKEKPIFYFTYTYQEDVPINFSYNKHYLKLESRTFGQIVTIDREPYNSTEIAFKLPSEHSLNGKFYDMEMQVLFRGSNNITKELMLSFLLEKTPGTNNLFFEDFDLFNIPNSQNRNTRFEKNLYIPKIFYNTDEKAGFIPDIKPFNFFQYSGSQSHPPCSENTEILVIAEPIKIGSIVIEMFKEALSHTRSKEKFTNAPSRRKIQQGNDRQIYYYEEKDCKINTIIVDKITNSTETTEKINNKLFNEISKPKASSLRKKLHTIPTKELASKPENPLEIHLNQENPVRLETRLYQPKNIRENSVLMPEYSNLFC